ncbi:MAG TPA: OPT family oligopeptide transporter [Candidatus Sulfotelmatobacter sp.]|nr:OPT family oligopeptide transporter [Candidatus Sulfotelmatobacter sp.]
MNDSEKGPAAEKEYELPLAGFTGTPEEIERQWFEQCYRGRGDSMRQLTWRAVLMGTVLGAVLSLTNLYIGLKSGWAMGVAITACILSYAIWTTFVKIGLARTPMTILENNCMQSTASSAGYSTGGTLVAAFAAFIMLNGHNLPLPLMFAWVFFLAVLGVTMAVPMKKQMINIEQLRFPSGVAAAETLRALHSHGQKGMRAAKALGIAGLISAIDNFIHDGFAAIPKLAAFSSDTLCTRLNEFIFGPVWMGRTVMMSWEPIFIASGAIMGMRVCLSILAGSIVCWMMFVPAFQHAGFITHDGFRDCVQWSLWPGVSCMVFASLLDLILKWRISLRAFRDLGKMFSPRSKNLSEMEAIETPMSWFAAGQIVSLIALGWLAHASFAMPYWQSAIAVVMSFALALVACRVTGETDTTPMGPMGKVTQLAFGALNPGNMNVNLMSANITAGAAASSADLLTDLKSGYLLGAHPRKQFIAQFAGIFIGTVVSVFAFTLIVNKPEVIGSDQFPAPSAQTWAAVARALSQGFEALAPAKIWSIVAGGAVGILFTMLPVIFPKQQKYLPSASGFGLAWIFQWYYGVLFFLGALIGWFWQKKSDANYKEFAFPVASGVMAGGALMGVAIIFWQNGPEMWHKFLGH